MVGKNYFEFATENGFLGGADDTFRGLRVDDDGHKANVVTVEPGGIIEGQQGPTASGSRAIVRGAEGTVKTYLASKGLLRLLRGTFGDAVITTPMGATLTRQYVFTTSNVASAVSFISYIGREMKNGGVDHDVYEGGQITEFRLAQALLPNSGASDAGIAKAEWDLNYAKVNRSASAHMSRTYVTPELYYTQGECTLRIGASLEDLTDECLNKFDLKVPTEIDVEDNCIRPSVTRDLAVRGGLPAPMLGLGWTYKNRTYYDAYLDGTILAFQAAWVASDIEIETGHNPSITVDIPAIQFTGSTPEMGEGKTTQDLPARVLWNETDPMITVTVVTSDTAY